MIFRWGYGVWWWIIYVVTETKRKPLMLDHINPNDIYMYIYSYIYIIGNYASEYIYIFIDTDIDLNIQCIYIYCLVGFSWMFLVNTSPWTNREKRILKWGETRDGEAFWNKPVFNRLEEYTNNWLGKLFGASENPTKIHRKNTQLRFWRDKLSQLSFTQSPESHHPWIAAGPDVISGSNWR